MYQGKYFSVTFVEDYDTNLQGFKGKEELERKWRGKNKTICLSKIWRNEYLYMLQEKGL